MFTSIAAKKDSIKFSEFEKRILKKFLEYARINFENGSGAYLATFDFDKIDFRWSVNMSSYLEIDTKNKDENITANAIQGAWTPIFYNSIFLNPNFYSNNFLTYLASKFEIYKVVIDKFITDIEKRLKSSNNIVCFSDSLDENNKLHNELCEKYSYSENEIYYEFCSKFTDYALDKFYYNYDFSDYNISRRQFKVRGVNHSLIHKSYIKDLNKFKFINTLFYEGNDIDLISFDSIKNDDNNLISKFLTCCHELYHKWQFSATILTPIFYIANIFTSLFFGYYASSKNKWLVEGDVRKYVDNKENELKLLNLHNSLVYIKLLGEIFVIEKHSYKNDEYKLLEIRKKINFNNKFVNKFDIKKIVDENKNKEYFKNKFIEGDEEEDQEITYYLKNGPSNDYKFNIKGTYEYQFILKLLQDEDLLTDEFIKYLNEYDKN